MVRAFSRNSEATLQGRERPADADHHRTRRDRSKRRGRTRNARSRIRTTLVGSMPAITCGINRVKLSYCGGRPAAIFGRPAGLRTKPRCVLKSTDTQVTSPSPSKCRALPIKDWGSRRSPTLVGSVATITFGINKMQLFRRIPCDDFRAGHRPTSKATICPGINRYEN